MKKRNDVERCVPFDIPELDAMKKRPEKLWYRGDLSLLEMPKVSIVGSRRPNAYTKAAVTRLAAALAKRGVVVVSGAAMGVDALAHRGAGSKNTVAVLGCGLNRRCPALNAQLIESIEREGLVLSPFEPDFDARGWTFVARNEIVVALGEVLVVAQADPNSGSMRSVAFARSMGKKMYVLPHRLGESEGTNDLLAAGEAEAIYDIDAFVEDFGTAPKGKEDEFLAFCKGRPTYEEAAKRFGERLFEAELEGLIAVVDGRVVPL